MNYYICERVITKNNKIEYCANKALFVSPPGVFTGRVIRVCKDCKNDLLNVYQIHSKDNKVFLNIYNTNVSKQIKEIIA